MEGFDLDGLEALASAPPLSWSTLPPELLIAVFGLLDERSLACAARVCRAWAAAVAVDGLWLQALLRAWPDARKLRTLRNAPWRELAKARVAAERRWARKAGVVRTVARQERGVIDVLTVGGDGLISCGLQTSLCLTSRSSGTQTELVGHTKFVCALTRLPALGAVAACSYDGTVSIWDCTTWTRSGILGGHQGPVLDCKPMPHSLSRLLTRSGRDGCLRLFDAETSVCITTYRQHTQSVTAMKAIDYDSFVSASRDGSVCVWDARQSRPLWRSAHHTCDAYHLLRTACGVMYSCSADSSIVAFDLAERRVIGRLATPEVPYVLKRSGGGRIVAGGGNGALLVVRWTPGDGEAGSVVALPGHRGTLNSLGVVGMRVVTAGLDSSVRVWEPRDSAETPFGVSMVFEKHHGDGIVRRLRCDHLGILTGGYDGAVREIEFGEAEVRQASCALQ